MSNSEIATELRRLAEKLQNGNDLEPLNFGQIIEKLKTLVASGASESWLTFDWGCAWPTGFDSYRGDYSQICIEFGGEHRHHVTVGKLLQDMKSLLGTDLTGWKGGEYTVDESKDVYVCCAGCTSETRIVDIVNDDGSATIITAKFERNW